jgi:hypothetical protein
VLSIPDVNETDDVPALIVVVLINVNAPVANVAGNDVMLDKD